MRELTTRDSFRSSKSSHREVIGGREFFFTSTKANRGIFSVFDTLTGVLVLVSVKDELDTKKWLLANIEEFNERIKPYERDTASLFG